MQLTIRVDVAWMLHPCSVKNKGVGGVRVLQLGVEETDSQKLHMMDKIRAFAELWDRSSVYVCVLVLV